MLKSTVIELDGQPRSVPEPAIRIRSLTRTFRSKDGAEHTVLDGVTLDVPTGSFLTLVGPSGCGKSTLIGMIAGLHAPTSGTIHVNGLPVRGVLRNVGLLFQKDSLLPWRNVLENVSLPLQYRGTPKKQAREAAAEWVRRVGLAAHSSKYPHQLSGGMRKRVSLAQTMVYEPEIVLMDEPFSALDAQTRALMENDLLTIWAAGSKTILFITHDLDEAIALSDSVAVMTAGPGKIKTIRRVELPRPRDLLEVRSNANFSEIYAQLWDHLRDEVVGRPV